MLTPTDQYWPLAPGVSRWGGVPPRKAPLPERHPSQKVTPPRKAPQGPAPFQLKTFPQRPCLVLMRAACPEGGLLSPPASFLQVFTTAEGVSAAACLSLSTFCVGLRAQSAPSGRVCSQGRTLGAWGPAPRAVGFPRLLHQRRLRPRLTPACGPRLPPTPRPRPPQVQAGKMGPVSPEEKPNPLQDANFCSRLFSW